MLPGNKKSGSRKWYSKVLDLSSQQIQQLSIYPAAVDSLNMTLLRGDSPFLQFKLFADQPSEEARLGISIFRQGNSCNNRT